MYKNAIKKIISNKTNNSIHRYLYSNLLGSNYWILFPCIEESILRKIFCDYFGLKLCVYYIV